MTWNEYKTILCLSNGLFYLVCDCDSSIFYNPTLSYRNKRSYMLEFGNDMHGTTWKGIRVSANIWLGISWMTRFSMVSIVIKQRIWNSRESSRMFMRRAFHRELKSVNTLSPSLECDLFGFCLFSFCTKTLLIATIYKMNERIRNATLYNFIFLLILRESTNINNILGVLWNIEQIQVKDYIRNELEWK